MLRRIIDTAVQQPKWSTCPPSSRHNGGRNSGPFGAVVNTKLFETNGKKQALILFETEGEATEALVCKHASSLDGSIIRISFSQLQNL